MSLLIETSFRHFFLSFRSKTELNKNVLSDKFSFSPDCFFNRPYFNLERVLTQRASLSDISFYSIGDFFAVDDEKEVRRRTKKGK